MNQPIPSFTASVAAFFGRLPNQTIGQFRDELMALTTKDRLEIAEMLNASGHPTQLPAVEDERNVHD